MKLSTRSRYGLRLMFRLAQNYGNDSVHLSQIAKMEGISQKYLGQIVIQLKSSGLIDSQRGAQGGYYLTREPGKITTREIVECLEGGLDLVDCLDTGKCTRIQGCPSRKLWDLLQEKIRETLEGVTLLDIMTWHEQDAENIVFEI